MEHIYVTYLLHHMLHMYYRIPQVFSSDWIFRRKEEIYVNSISFFLRFKHVHQNIILCETMEFPLLIFTKFSQSWKE